VTIRYKQTGFTIVELLIVIVIIGILAAITIVAYNGIQQRAKNSQRITAAKEWQKRIIAYTATNSAYPAGTIGGHSCLGSDGYPTDLDANADVDCHSSGNVKHPLAAINTAYATLGSLPIFPGDKLESGTGYGTVAGISVRSAETLDPAGTPKLLYPMLYYWLLGANQDCTLRPVLAPVTGGYQQTSANFTSSSTAGTLCIIALPDPANL
jgi:prepilin-type N-terminal cleavage/methylation domain-containing protein